MMKDPINIKKRKDKKMASRPKLLIVDDEADIAHTLASHFRFTGYETDIASNGREALRKLAVESVEVVITDIKMPEMDGIDLLREIKRLYPMTRVIVITGQVTLDNLFAVFRHGADRCCFKPLTDLTELDAAVERAVDDLKTWQQKLKEVNRLKE